MQTLKKLLLGESNSTNTIVKYAKDYVLETWQILLEEKYEELQQVFAKYGDRAYGMYVQKLMLPLQKQILDANFSIKKGFIMEDSIENWGPPEERERCMWYVIKQDETPLGTLILQFYHSHTEFHLPKAPHIFLLETTDRNEILDKLSHASTRIHDWASEGYQNISNDGIQKWEYSVDVSLDEYLKPHRGQIFGSAVDYALASWGRNGWELVSITPTHGKLVAFFKRPKK